MRHMKSDHLRGMASSPIAVGLAMGAAVLLATVLVRSLMSPARDRRQVKQQAKDEEGQRDHTLKETFPASDPPASRDFSIPVNVH